jgi:hypothetical protein
MYYLTNNGSDWTLKVELRSFEGICKVAEYSDFAVASETDKYRLTIGGFTEDANGPGKFKITRDPNYKLVTHSIAPTK